MQNVQIGEIDGSIGLLCIVVCQDSQVAECPAKDIVDDQDGAVRVAAGLVGLVVSEGRLGAGGFARPVETCLAAFTHFV